MRVCERECLCVSAAPEWPFDEHLFSLICRYQLPVQGGTACARLQKDASSVSGVGSHDLASISRSSDVTITCWQMNVDVVLCISHSSR